MVSRFLILVCACLATKIVEYTFGTNYGQVFHDFSGNSRDGVNGASSATSSEDTIATDRGAYFGNGNYQITLPANDQQASAFSLPSTFTIAAWIFPFNVNGLIFYRYKDSNDYFYLTRTTTGNALVGRIVISGTDSGDLTALTSSCPSSKY